MSLQEWITLKRLLTAVAAAFLIFGLTACSSGNGNKQVVVKTSAGNITKGDLYNKLKTSYGKQVLANMVYEKILDKKYDVSKKLDKQVKQYKKNYGKQFKSWLQSQGFANESQFKQQLKLQLLVQKAETAGVNVSDKQMKAYYNKHKKDQFTEIKVSHILVKNKSTAQTIEQKLKNGASFASMAKQHSTDKASAKKGGNLGYITQSSNLVQPFLDAAFKLKVGQISKPVQSQYGWHIIKCTDKKPIPFSKAKSTIKKTLEKQKAKSTTQLVQQLNKDGNIKVEDKYFKGLFKNQKPKQSSQSNGSSSNKSSKSGSNGK